MYGSVVFIFSFFVAPMSVHGLACFFRPDVVTEPAAVVPFAECAVRAEVAFLTFDFVFEFSAINQYGMCVFLSPFGRAGSPFCSAAVETTFGKGGPEAAECIFSGKGHEVFGIFCQEAMPGTDLFSSCPLVAELVECYCGHRILNFVLIRCFIFSTSSGKFDAKYGCAGEKIRPPVARLSAKTGFTLPLKPVSCKAPYTEPKPLAVRKQRQPHSIGGISSGGNSLFR